MKHLMLIGALAITGCSVDNPQVVQHSYTVEQHDETTGLTLNPSENMYVSFSEMVNIYNETMACVGMTAAGPTVSFNSFSANNLGGSWGFYHVPGKQIWINTDDDASKPERNRDTDIAILKHEYTHHILRVAGNTSGHPEAFFPRCGPFIN